MLVVAVVVNDVAAAAAGGQVDFFIGRRKLADAVGGGDLRAIDGERRRGCPAPTMSVKVFTALSVHAGTNGVRRSRVIEVTWTVKVNVPLTVGVPAIDHCFGCRR